jgi:hypothetical protein
MNRRGSYKILNEFRESALSRGLAHLWPCPTRRFPLQLGSYMANLLRFSGVSMIKGRL